jgi:hypothetical protein
MDGSIDRPSKLRRTLRLWPWLLLVVMTIPAVWHAVDFPDDIDDEYPAVVRPTFSRCPPPAYRLAEPGDTIDRIAIYLSSGAIVLALLGTGLGLDGEQRRRWGAALAVSMAAFWYAANPGPTFDGWHGLGWRSIFEPDTPIGQKLVLAGAGLGLLGVLAIGLGHRPKSWPALWVEARGRGVAALLTTAAVLALLRPFEIPRLEPAGYWPRWAFVLALVVFCSALARLLPRTGRGRLAALSLAVGCVLGWYGLVVGGIWLTWYHRPLERLRAVVPGKIYISAMPTERGLEIAQQRHHFKTIVNLFPEDTPLRSPRLPQELRFVRRNSLVYLRSPSDQRAANDFLDLTLRLAQDPDAWPILVHCHGCMDRTPAWVGVYQFVVEGRPLAEIMTFIERHRGYRPKASVTLLYNRILPRLAPERYALDPSAALLSRCAGRTRERSDLVLGSERAEANLDAPGSVVEGASATTAERLPSLTPRR